MLYWFEQAKGLHQFSEILKVDKNFKLKRGNELRHTNRARKEFLKGEAAPLNKWKFIMSKKMPFLTNRIFGGENPFEKKIIDRTLFHKRYPTKKAEQIPQMKTEEDDDK